MARGSVIWRCRKHGNKTGGSCDCPGGAYSIAFVVGGRRKWEKVGRTKKEAEHRLAEILTELNQGTYQPPQPMLVRDFAQRWLRDYAEGAVKPMTLRSYRGLVRNHLTPMLGELWLTQLSPQRIQGVIAQCLRERGLSPKTANNCLILLKTILKFARQWGLLRDNPAEEIKPLRVESKEMDFLRPEEIQLLLKHADEPYRTLFLTAVLTGMRRGELLALQWGDIDWHNHVIRVRRSLFWHSQQELAELQLAPAEGPVQGWRFSTPKSKRSIRTIIMSPRLREALELYRLSCPVSPQDLVFCTREGTPMEPNNMIHREFLPTLRRAGLRHIRFHDLRHTFTTLLIAQGVNVKAIQAQLGHASIQTTLDRYGHLLPETQQYIGERLDALVFDSSQLRANRVLTQPSSPGAISINHPQNPLDPVPPISR